MDSELPIDNLDKLLTKCGLFVVEYFATVEVHDQYYRVVFGMPITNWEGTVMELRELIFNELEKLGYKL